MLTGRKLALTLAFTVLVVVAFGVSCKGFFVKPTVTAITIGPTGQTLAPGGTLQMVASGTMSDGSPNQIVTNQCLWSSSNAGAATIGKNTGLATAPATIVNPPQQTTITAAFQALTPATATLSACPAVQNLVLTDGGVTTVKANDPSTQTITFTATGAFSGGSQQDVSSEVTWNVSNTSMLTVTGGVGTTAASLASGTSTTVSATLCNFTSNVLTITAQ
jgi:hypothetical protein